MSTPRSEQTKTTKFTQEVFEEQWEKLEKLAREDTASKKSSAPKLQLVSTTNSDSAAKAQEKSAWKDHVSKSDPSAALNLTQAATTSSGKSAIAAQSTNFTQTTTQTCTTTQTSPMTHSAPVIVPRKQLRFAEDLPASPASRQEKDRARGEKVADSPRRNQIQSKEAKKYSGTSTPSTPPSSPTGTPREKNEHDIDSPRTLATERLKKPFGEKISKMTLDFSKIYSDRKSPAASPKSSGRASPTKPISKTPRKDWPPAFTSDFCNNATKIIERFKKDDSFQKSSPAIQKLLINAKLSEVLKDEHIPFDLKKLSMLAEEVERLSQNAVIDVEMDLTKDPYLESVRTIQDYMKQSFGKNTDRGDHYNKASDEDKKKMRLLFEPYFLRDLSGGKVILERESDDGKVEIFDSVWDLAHFLNEGDPESELAESLANSNAGEPEKFFTRSRYISHFTSQHLVGYMGKVGFGILPELPCHIKLHDGTEIIPKGEVTTRYRFKKMAEGGVEVQILYEVRPDCRRESQKKAGGYVSVDLDARLTLSMNLYLYPNRELHTSSLRLHAEGWNLQVPGKYDDLG